MQRTYNANQLINLIRNATVYELTIICDLVREEEKTYNEFDSTLLLFAIHMRRMKLEEDAQA